MLFVCQPSLHIFYIFCKKLFSIEIMYIFRNFQSKKAIKKFPEPFYHSENFSIAFLSETFL